MAATNTYGEIAVIVQGRVEDEMLAWVDLGVLNTLSFSHILCFLFKTSLKFMVLLVSKRSFVFLVYFYVCFSIN